MKIIGGIRIILLCLFCITISKESNGQNTTDISTQLINATIIQISQASTQTITASTDLSSSTTNRNIPTTQTSISSSQSTIPAITTLSTLSLRATQTTSSTTPTPTATIKSTKVAPTTEIFTTTLNPTTLTTLAIITDVPVKVGEYSSKIQMGCKFQEQFYPEYKDTNSQKYKDYTQSVYNKMREKLLLQLIRLINLIFLSLEEGSVFANMQLVMATNTSMTDNALKNSIQTATIEAFPNVTISNFTVIQSPTTASTIQIPGWGIALIIIACVIAMSFVLFIPLLVILNKRETETDIPLKMNIKSSEF